MQPETGKIFLIVGLLLVVAGILLLSGKSFLGRLPGDFQYTRGTFKLYFPLATCLLLSVLISIVLWLFRR